MTVNCQLSTPRLILRELTEQDWEEIAVLRTDVEVNRYLDRPTAETREKAMDFIHRIQQLILSGESYYWAISLKDLPQLIGTICLWNLSADRLTAEIGYELLPAHQGMGLMNEALSSVVHFAFTTLQLRQLEAYIHPDNQASERLLLRNDFHKIGLDQESGLLIFSLKNSA